VAQASLDFYLNFLGSILFGLFKLTSHAPPHSAAVPNALFGVTIVLSKFLVLAEGDPGQGV